MKIAIHNRKGSFSDQWIEYCEANSIPYKIVNCYSSDIIHQLTDCDALMWHYHHGNYKDNLFAKQLLFSLMQAGKKIFPDFNTAWHFNDKLGQKYLFEALNVPTLPSYVFYTKKDALEWANNTSYPVVFKLRSGAGSSNVQLVKNKRRAKKLISKAFGKGFPYFNRLGYFKDRLNKFLNSKDNIWGVVKGLGRLIIPIKDIHLVNKEKGYIYFQKFIPNNNFDIRVIVIGDKAFAIKRIVRKNDFRASGSGKIIYNKNEIDIICIKIAFETSEKIKSQCLAYDFIFDEKNNPLIVEISYGFSQDGYNNCEGYWDSKLNWYPGHFNPYGWMVDNILAKI